jgi:hypothetical protein
MAMAGALANLGYQVCDQSVGSVLLRHGLPPAPERKRTTILSAFFPQVIPGYCPYQKPHRAWPGSGDIPDPD